MFRRTTCPGRINCRRRLSHVEAIRRVAAASVAYSAEAKTVLASSARLHPYVAAITGLGAVVVSPGDGINLRTLISVVPTPSGRGAEAAQTPLWPLGLTITGMG